MNKTLIVLAATLTFLSTGGVAFAYQAPSQNVTTSFQGGAGEVDFTKPSQINATFTLANVQDESVWATAGNVSGGEAGYGFFAHENQLYLVTSTGPIERMMPLQFIRTGAPITVSAVFTPGNGVRVDTNSVGSGWSEYSKAIQQDGLAGYIRGLGAFYASVASRNNPANLFVGSWSYTQ